MKPVIWNINTKYVVVGFILALIGILIVEQGVMDSSMHTILIVLSILIFLGGLALQITGMYKASHFFKEDAHTIFMNILELIEGLKSLSQEGNQIIEKENKIKMYVEEIE